MRRRILLLATFMALLGAGLAFTKLGRAVLAELGLAKACEDGCS